MRLPRAVKQRDAAPAPAGGASRSPSPAAAAPRRRRGRRALAIVSAGVALCVLAWLLRAQLLTGVARVLTVHEPLRRADAIFVLGGDPDVRPFAAAELYRRGWAPRVLVAHMQPGRAARMGLQVPELEVDVGILRREGVPARAIRILEFSGGPTSSTTEDAEALAEYVRRHRVRRVIAVTTDYHTRRARWSIRRALRGTGAEVIMTGTPAADYDETNWWKSEAGLLAYYTEYVKFARYLIAGGAN